MLNNKSKFLLNIILVDGLTLFMIVMCRVFLGMVLPPGLLVFFYVTDISPFCDVASDVRLWHACHLIYI
jgi:hypothetical protein